ncbi:nucleoporin NDC1 isoform X2 [Nematostella vectensis]|uniref:nucleoporin NDC1 isoform X2 n=1 Tax=Nematostella vectensis TaxID=45351 RepID=UPI0020778258|nr:nucleoporin NDC1 isoform X2 [Nematostella vectensis]
MTTEKFPGNTQERKLDVRWFTEGEFLWRSGASVAWLILFLPFLLLVYYAIASFDPLHPITWLTGFVSIAFETQFLIAVTFFSVITGFLAVCKGKLNSVQGVIHYSRVTSLLYLLHPARLFHTLVDVPCGMFCVWITTWLLMEPFNSLTAPISDSEDECYLNEPAVFLVTFGGWLGFYASLMAFLYNEFHYKFPKIQQRKFFLVKAAVWPCVYKSIALTFRATRWYYFLYWLAGNFPRYWLGNFLVASVNESEVPLNTISGLMNFRLLWLVLSTGMLLTFVWSMRNMLFVIFNTQRYIFPIESAVLAEKSQCLTAVLKDTSSPLLRHLAFLDLCQLSKFSSLRRKQLFSLSQPGGRPTNWTSISEECLEMLSTLTSDITDHVEYQMQVQQFTTEQRSFVGTPGKITKVFSGSLSSPLFESPIVGSPHGTPATVTRRPKLWSALKEGRSVHSPVMHKEMNGNSTTRENIERKKREKVDKWRVQMIPHYIANFLKQRPIVEILFKELPDYRSKTLFANCQLHIWAVEGLSRLVVASFKEDTFGVVQKTLPDILSSLLSLLQALDQCAKFSSATAAGAKTTIQPRPPRPQGPEGNRHLLRLAVTSALYRITNTFRDHLYGIPMTQDHRDRLQSFLDCKE